MSYEILHLDPDEHVIMEVRKHWIAFAGYGLGLLFVALLPVFVLAVLSTFVPQLFVIDLPVNASALFLFFYALWLLFVWASFFLHWTNYYLDVWYVTEHRIIAVDQRQMFSREVSNIRFDKIQDVTLDHHGFMSAFLGFGNIRVQTASEDSKEFYMTCVQHPEEVRKVIFDHQNKSNKLLESRIST
jgi:uncharacterized membrane protein YdbT with pleckstrin-like domain